MDPQAAMNPDARRDAAILALVRFWCTARIARGTSDMAAWQHISGQSKVNHRELERVICRVWDGDVRLQNLIIDATRAA